MKEETIAFWEARLSLLLSVHVNLALCIKILQPSRLVIISPDTAKEHLGQSAQRARPFLMPILGTVRLWRVSWWSCHFPTWENWRSGDTPCILLTCWFRKLKVYQYFLSEMFLPKSLRCSLLELPPAGKRARYSHWHNDEMRTFHFHRQSCVEIILLQCEEKHSSFLKAFPEQKVWTFVGTLPYPETERVFWLYEYTYG